MRISDWSSDVCSSDLSGNQLGALVHGGDRRGGVVDPHDLEAVGDRGDEAAHDGGVHAPDAADAEGIHHRQLAGIDDEAARFQEVVEGLEGERSEERRVGKESVGTGKYRWSPYH